MEPEELQRLLDAAQRMHECLPRVAQLATLGEMAAGIAHELNQPLTAIASYAQACTFLLARDQADLAEVTDALREITAQSLRAAEVLRRLRAVAQPKPAPPMPVDANELIEDLQSLLVTDARLNEVHLTLELGAGLPRVLVDRGQIQQVLLSLVHNAIEAVAGLPLAERHIAIRTEHGPGGELQITFLDAGPGVEETIRERLFAPFCTTKAAGCGLGLAMSRSIVEQHHGTLRYRRTENSTCFVLQLPAAPREA